LTKFLEVIKLGYRQLTKNIMNNKIKVSIIVLIVIIAIFGLALITKHNVKPTTSTTASKTQTVNNKVTTSKTIVSQTKGMLYFTLSDEETSYAGEVAGVTAVNVVIDKVQAYNEAYGWVTLSQVPQTFDLIQLKAGRQAVLLAKASVPANKYPVPENTYTDFRIHMAKVTVSASGVTRAATLPSANLDVKTVGLVVGANSSSAVHLNIMAVVSLHQTDKGEFIFTPVVAFDSRANATVQIGKNNIPTVSFGEAGPSINAGMDVNGQMETDFMIKPTAKVSIVGGVITAQ